VHHAPLSVFPLNIGGGFVGYPPRLFRQQVAMLPSRLLSQYTGAGVGPTVHPSSLPPQSANALVSTHWYISLVESQNTNIKQIVDITAKPTIVINIPIFTCLLITAMTAKMDKMPTSTEIGIPASFAAASVVELNRVSIIQRAPAPSSGRWQQYPISGAQLGVQKSAFPRSAKT
jgi:hypothetical protein